jgi:Cu/Ag efflux protein CusF
VKKHIVWLCAVTVVCFAASALYAQTEKPKGDKARTPSAFGKVLKLDKTAKTLTIEERQGRGQDATTKDVTFAYTDETKVVLSAGRGVEPKPATIDDLKVDVRVFIMYKAAEGEGKNPVAVNISIRPEGAGKGGKGGTKPPAE